MNENTKAGNTETERSDPLNDHSSPTSEEREEESFSEIFEASLKPIQEGEVVQGSVIQVTPDYVVVDVGYKSEGQIAIEEFKKDRGEATVSVGDRIDVLLEQWEDENGMMVLSREKAEQMQIWDEIGKSFDKDEIIEGRISARIKGGLSVDIGVPAFLPGSQVDLQPVRNLDRLIGKTFQFKVLKYNKKRGNIVLSRRVLLEKAREAQRRETLKTLEEGQVIEGIIKNITDYGVFIDLGGVDGLLHITDISWGRVTSPAEMFTMGDKIKVKILNFDRENERVSLGYKQTKPDPWESVEEKYPRQSRVKGKVVSLTNYGAFVELEQGIEGLIHISEMSWTKKVKHPSQIISVGDIVEAVVLDLDVAKRRISLGIKYLEPNPWEVIEEKYPPGTVMEGKVKNITEFGIFVGIDEGIDGLIHISDLSWTQRIKHPSELYKKGQTVQAVVLNIDRTNERFSLGIKQLEEDPWEHVPEKYRARQIIEGTVTNVTDFGIFLELEKGVEGLVHVSELSAEKVDKPQGFANVGDKLSAVITNIDKRARRISLSIKDIDTVSEESDVEEYLAKQEAPSSSLGDVIGQRLDKMDAAEGTAEALEGEPQVKEPEQAEVKEAAEESPRAEAPAEPELLSTPSPSEETVDEQEGGESHTQPATQEEEKEEAT
jgi:small subunit ribosomal protein S1